MILQRDFFAANVAAVILCQSLIGHDGREGLIRFRYGSPVAGTTILDFAVLVNISIR
jgi:hypothetical protein